MQIRYVNINVGQYDSGSKVCRVGDMAFREIVRMYTPIDTTHQPAVSLLMFNVSGAHTLEEFRKHVAARLECHPAELSDRQRSNDGWLMVCAIREAAEREDRETIARCSRWLESLLRLQSFEEPHPAGKSVSPRLITHAYQAIDLQNESKMLSFRALHLNAGGRTEEAFVCFARSHRLAGKNTDAMSERAARAYAELLLKECIAVLAAEPQDASADIVKHLLRSYLDLGLFRASRLHWNVLSVAIEASAHGWLDLTGFLATWRPQYLQVGVSHR